MGISLEKDLVKRRVGNEDGIVLVRLVLMVCSFSCIVKFSSST